MLKHGDGRHVPCVGLRHTLALSQVVRLSHSLACAVRWFAPNVGGVIGCAFEAFIGMRRASVCGRHSSRCQGYFFGSSHFLRVGVSNGPEIFWKIVGVSDGSQRPSNNPRTFLGGVWRRILHAGFVGLRRRWHCQGSCV